MLVDGESKISDGIGLNVAGVVKFNTLLNPHSSTIPPKCSC